MSVGLELSDGSYENLIPVSPNPTLSENVQQIEGIQKPSAAFLVATVTPPLKPPPKTYHIWAQMWFMEDTSTPLTYRVFKLPALVQTHDFSYLFFRLHLQGLEDLPGSCFAQNKPFLLLFQFSLFWFTASAEKPTVEVQKNLFMR